MDYRYIKAFILTAQHASFSKAAEIMGIAQSAVSRQIKLLEDSLGEELIIRSSKKVLLTAKGRELYVLASNFDKTAMQIFEKEDSRPIKIGILNGLLINWFYNIILQFNKLYDRNLEVSVLAPEELRDGISNGKFDIVFSTENIQSELITSLKLFKEKLSLISKTELQLDQLDNYRWIVYSNDDNIFKLQATPSKRILMINNISTIVNLVKQGVGIAVVPNHILKKNDKFFRYDVDDDKESHIYMSTLNYKTLPPYITQLIRVIKDDLEKNESLN